MSTWDSIYFQKDATKISVSTFFFLTYFLLHSLINLEKKIRKMCGASGQIRIHCNYALVKKKDENLRRNAFFFKMEIL
jgi:hypothetical protein